MNIVTGIDIVDIVEFKRQLAHGGENMLKRIYFDSESENATLESLAGIFASKEAVIKALSLGHSSWKKILVKYSSEGRPFVELIGFENEIISGDLSISHTDSTAVAHFVALIS